MKNQRLLAAKYKTAERASKRAKLEDWDSDYEFRNGRATHSYRHSIVLIDGLWRIRRERTFIPR